MFDCCMHCERCLSQTSCHRETQVSTPWHVLYITGFDPQWFLLCQNINPQFFCLAFKTLHIWGYLSHCFSNQNPCNQVVYFTIKGTCFVNGIFEDFVHIFSNLCRSSLHPCYESSRGNVHTFGKLEFCWIHLLALTGTCCQLLKKF